MQSEFFRRLIHPHAIGVITVLCALGVEPIAIAADGQWTTAKVEYIVRKKDLREFLRQFAGEQGLSVEIGDGVEGQVTGEFNLTPPRLLDSLGPRHGFSWRIGGSILYISPAARTTAESVQLRLSTVDQLKSSLDTLAAKGGADASGATGAIPQQVLTPFASVSDGDALTPGSRWLVKQADRTLSVTFLRWAREAGWKLLWESPLDYVIDSDATVESTFEDAVETIARSLANSETPMRVIFYKRNKVVRILAKGAQ